MTLSCAVLLCLLLAGCVTTGMGGSVDLSAMKRPASAEITAPPGVVSRDPDEHAKIMQAIEERNRTVEDDQEWIKRSYSDLLVRRMGNVSEREYKEYAGYLDNGVAYVVVHPAYFPFFHGFKRLGDTPEEGPYTEENVIEKFLALTPNNARFAVLQAQERRTRDFIEYVSTRGKLLIVIVPKNYSNYKGYTYKGGMDEYKRYLNEITNMSKSVLFVESKSPNKGYVTEEDSVRLMEFLLSINAKGVYVGGGYVGRCLENFYTLLTKDFGTKGVFLVPEMSDISPSELSDSLSNSILRQDGTLDTEVLTRLMKTNAYRVQETLPNVHNLGNNPDAPVED
jgi:hypothetical protein